MSFFGIHPTKGANQAKTTLVAQIGLHSGRYHNCLNEECSLHCSFVLAGNPCLDEPDTFTRAVDIKQRKRRIPSKFFQVRDQKAHVYAIGQLDYSCLFSECLLFLSDVVVEAAWMHSFTRIGPQLRKRHKRVRSSRATVVPAADDAVLATASGIADCGFSNSLHHQLFYLLHPFYLTI